MPENNTDIPYSLWFQRFCLWFPLTFSCIYTPYLPTYLPTYTALLLVFVLPGAFCYPSIIFQCVLWRYRRAFFCHIIPTFIDPHLPTYVLFLFAVLLCFISAWFCCGLFVGRTVCGEWDILPDLRSPFLYCLSLFPVFSPEHTLTRCLDPLFSVSTSLSILWIKLLCFTSTPFCYLRIRFLIPGSGLDLLWKSPIRVLYYLWTPTSCACLVRTGIVTSLPTYYHHLPQAWRLPCYRTLCP